MSKVETIDVQIQVGKESKELADALSELVKDIREGKNIGEISSENLPGIVQAVDGYDKLDDEQKAPSRHATRAYIGMKISEAIDEKKESA